MLRATSRSRSSWLVGAIVTLAPSVVLAQSEPSSAPAAESSAAPSGAPEAAAGASGSSGTGTSTGTSTGGTSSGTSPSSTTSASGSSGTSTGGTSSSTNSGEQRVEPSSIGSSSVPVPPATSGERAAATAATPAHAQGNQHHEEDNGRSVDFLFIQLEGGYSTINLTGISSMGRILPGLTELQQNGYGGGATIGFRTWIFAVAAHGYISRFISGPAPMGGMNSQDFDLGQVMLEGQIRLPVPIIEPYIRVGLGYAWLGEFQLNSMYMDSTSTIHGFTGKVGAGADLWLGKYFTIGIGGDFSLMNLRRDGVQREGSVCPETDPTCIELRQDGDAVGWLFSLHLQVGLHF